MIAAILYNAGLVTRISPFQSAAEAKAHLRWMRQHYPDRFDRVRFRHVKTIGELDKMREEHKLIN